MTLVEMMLKEWGGNPGGSARSRRIMDWLQRRTVPGLKSSTAWKRVAPVQAQGEVLASGEAR